MIPRDTSFRLAKTPADYRRCRQLLLTHAAKNKLRWPTIMAERAGTLVAIFGTEAWPHAVVAGPFVTDKAIPRPGFLLMRMWDLYEAVLGNAGVSVYLCPVLRDNAPMNAWFAKLGIEASHVVKDVVFYQKRVGNWGEAA